MAAPNQFNRNSLKKYLTNKNDYVYLVIAMRKKQKRERLINTMVRLPKEVWEEVKKIAEEEMTSASQVVRRAVVEWLKKRKRKC